jgi:putative Mn2+ efflux pump MntP
MIELVILALALSMDAFAVSIGLGTKYSGRLSRLGIRAGLYFGISQGFMPLIGYLAGQTVLEWVDTFAPWIAFALLFLIGSKMIYDALSEGIEEDIIRITHKVMLVLAIATSIDAMAAGFTLEFFDVDPFVACLIIGITTFFLSWMGVIVGAKTGDYFESKAELLGGIVLILIGLKILIF